MPISGDVSTTCVDAGAIFYETRGKRLVVEKEFNITYTHARLKSEKESAYTSIQRKRKREGEGGYEAVNRSLLVRESKILWQKDMARNFIPLLCSGSFSFFTFSFLNQNDY
jgi:hypothetical protein